jgi:hypothetical protein
MSRSINPRPANGARQFGQKLYLTTEIAERVHIFSAISAVKQAIFRFWYHLEIR